MDIYCGDIYADCFSNIFDISKYGFYVEEAYEPRSRIDFPNLKSLSNLSINVLKK
jgi:hypothetical protein